MRDNITEVDYVETNNLSKGFLVRKTYLTEITLPNEGGGSANGQSSGNPAHTFDENIDMPKFPGYENKSPGKDFEWRGSTNLEKNKGNWYNKKTGEYFHFDMKHPVPIKPHWDYKHPNGWERGYRIFPDGSWERKIFENGVIIYG